MNTRRHLYFLLLLFLGCTPAKEYYKFKFKSFSVDISLEAAQGRDSIVVLKAVSPVGDDRLISYDKRKLREFAFENDLKVSYLPTETVIEKIVPISDSLRRDAIIRETQIQMPKIKELAYYGRAAAKDSTWVNNDIAFEMQLRRKKSARQLTTALIFIGVLSIGAVFLVIRATEQMIEEATSGCYIATACYGSYNAPEVIVLRTFRDQVLKKYLLGRLFIRFYYATSPVIATKLSMMHGLNKLVRTIILDPIVRLVQAKF